MPNSRKSQRSRSYPTTEGVLAKIPVDMNGRRLCTVLKNTTEWRRDEGLRKELLEFLDGDETDLLIVLEWASNASDASIGRLLNVDYRTIQQRRGKALRRIRQGVLGKLASFRLQSEGACLMSILTTSKVPIEIDAYAVSLVGFERPFRRRPEWRQIRDWLNDHWEQLEADVKHELRTPCMGGWHDAKSGNFVLDASVLTADKEEAIQVAQEQQQVSIYHLATKRVINV